MRPKNNKNSSKQPIPSVSVDFLMGNSADELERIRTRLLDLTNRNRLLNFRHTKTSSLRFVDACIDSTFTRLRDGKPLLFQAVPEPEASHDKTTAKEHAEESGWNTLYDLSGTDRRWAALQVLLYREALDALSRKIGSTAKTLVEESGVNMLHLVFGFLEWYESDDSRQAHLAPLISMPVALERVANKRGFVEFSVEYSGEDIQSNLSLVEKMRRDFGLELPLLEDDDTPESYFAKFEDILRLKTTWKVRSQMSLALLSFGKLLMYRDLDPKTWPAGESLAEHPLVRGLFEGSKQSGVEFSEEYLIDAPELKAEVPLLIRDADSSQHSALIDALRGRNLVIEGPPGTGKSQTITNLIAAALAKGKTVLFVSEKLAALEVVRKRLDEVDLGAFCFEVHSHKTKKGELLHDLSRRYALRGTLKDPNALDQHLFIVEQRKQALIRHASLIHTIVDPFGSTVFDILWTCDCSRQVMAAHQERLGQLFLPVLARHTQTDFTQTE